MKYWFIIGISIGLGIVLVEAVIENGDYVIGTFRNPLQIEKFNPKYTGKSH